MHLRSALLLLPGLLAVASTVRADPPAAVPLPAPQLAPAEPVPHVVLVPPMRVSAYAVWEMNAVDRRGYFRPRVAATPQGAFYLYNGAPYPWTSTNSLHYMPYARD